MGRHDGDVSGGGASEGVGSEGVGSERIDGYERLWSPWRLEYVADPDHSNAGCPFCIAEDDEENERVIHRGEHAFVLLNAYPYNPGHVMVIPYTHTEDYADLTTDEVAEMAVLTQRTIRALRVAAGPHAFNVGMNLGAVAGAGIAAHLHQHVVPRWGGDTNFMPIIGQTRVLPQLMANTYELLKPAFDATE